MTPLTPNTKWRVCSTRPVALSQRHSINLQVELIFIEISSKKRTTIIVKLEVFSGLTEKCVRKKEAEILSKRHVLKCVKHCAIKIAH